MPNSSLTTVVRAAERVRRAEERLLRARAELRAAIVAAHEGGASLAAIARALGVTRQRVAQIAQRPDTGRIAAGAASGDRPG